MLREKATWLPCLELDYFLSLLPSPSPAVAMARTSQRQYSQDLHRRVIKKWTAGMSERKIGHLDMPRVSVQTIIRFEKKHDHVNLKPRPGRPRCTDLRHDRRIVREVEKNRFVSAESIAAQVSKEIKRPPHPRPYSRSGS
ncbi:hypothetical protein PC116_g6433 [Phytophthora cactorum]|nr:hypothetical protein Pcac1_g19167 [Phytophthora cactorum]KAG4245775.1 hypothetical protein PC116_g6433 [Phytophthora cactorum]